MALTAHFTDESDDSHLAEQHRTRLLRSRLFLTYVLLATVAATLLAYFGATLGRLPLDLELTRFIQALANPGVHAFLQGVTWVGFPPQSNIIWGAVIVLLFVIGWRFEAFGFLMAAAGSAILWLTLAPLVDRARPSPELVRVTTELHTGSYPSGHVLNLTAIFGFLIFIVITMVGYTLLRRLLVSILAIPILVVGVARVYDGAHWPTDVLGGYLIGSIWLGLSIGVYQELRAVRARRRDRSLSGADGSDSPAGLLGTMEAQWRPHQAQQPFPAKSRSNERARARSTRTP